MRLRKQVDNLDMDLAELEVRIEDVRHENIKRCAECLQHVDNSVEELRKRLDDQADIFAKGAKAQFNESLGTFNSIQKLQGQVRCGITGHNFELTKGVWAIYSTDEVVQKVVGYRGRFECRNCGLFYTRKLTTQEINAAKKLGLIKK